MTRVENEGWAETPEEEEERADKVAGSQRRATLAERRAEASFGQSVGRRASWTSSVSAELHAAGYVV